MNHRVRTSTLGLLILHVAPGITECQEVLLPDSLPPGVTAEMVARGKVVFEGDGLCSNCHGADAMGLLGPNLTDSEWWHAQGSYLSIVQQVLVGVPEAESESGTVMPPKGGSNIGEADVQAVAAYVWRLSHPEAGDSLPLGVTQAMIERGQTVFEDHGGCINCHGSEAGGALGPDLTDERWLHAKGNYLSIVRQILVGVPAEKSRSGVIMMPRGGSNISDSDVEAVAAYVWVLSRPKH